MNQLRQPMKLFGVPFSVHTRKAIIAARLKSVPYELVPVVPVVPASLPPNWSRISPTGLIPAIEDGGFTLADSTAIVLYLERKTAEPRLVPEEVEEYGRALFLDSWAGTALFRDVVRPAFHAQVVEPKVHGRPRDDGAIESALEKAAGAFAYLESVEPNDFFVGSRLSIADLAIVSNLVMFRYLGHAIDPGRFPKLAAYFARQIAARPFRDVLVEERPFAMKMGLVFPDSA